MANVQILHTPILGVVYKNLTVKIPRWLKNVSLFLLAPFLGLTYIIAFPVVGFGMMWYVLYRKYLGVRFITHAISVPFITILFVLFGPLFALGCAVYYGTKALFLNPLGK